MSKHTPGPWKVAGKVDHHQRIICAAGHGVAHAYKPTNKSDDAERVANARLIAAAPELLEALQSCVSYLADLNGCEWIKGDDPGSKDMRQRAKALQRIAFDTTAKATGE